MIARLLASLALVVAAPSSAEIHRVDWSTDDLGRSAAVAAPVIFWPRASEWPARLVRVEIPPDARVDAALWIATEERELSRPPRLPDPDPHGTFDLGPARLTSEGYRYWILPETSFRGHRIANLAVTPYRVTSDGRRFEIESFSVDVRTSTASTPALRRRVAFDRTADADARALSLLLDTQPLETANAHRDGPVDQPIAPIEYVIVTADALVPAFQELADFKTREGMPAAVTPVSWILANYDGIDAPARVRSYLRDLYLHRGLRYALLGGDTGQVPVRLARNKFQSTGAGTLVTADAYFACLDGDWNADGDAEIGEAPNILEGIEGDDVDLVADISVARVPASTAAEAASFVAKWKSYTGYDPANFRTDYQDRILALAEVLFPSNWTTADGPEAIITDGADFAESTLAFVPDEFDRLRLYQYHDNPDHQPAFPELKETVVQEINSGYGIIDHVGHGFRTVMSVGDDRLLNSDVDAFTNTNAYSLLYGINCTSGAVLFDCIGEHLINNPAGGVVASVSSADLDYPTASDAFKYEFFRLIFEEDITRLADAFFLADLPQAPLAATGENVLRWTIMTLIAFGDPAMDIWRGTPRTATVDVPATVPVGAGELMVTVTESGTPVPDATVCLVKDDAYVVGTTAADGVAALPFTPSTPGPVRVTVTKNTFAPAIDSTNVVATNAPALFVQDVIFQDGTAEGGFGNGDGTADAGETVLVDVVVRNEGGALAIAGGLDLEIDSPYITTTDAFSPIPPLDAGAETTLTAAFAFDVDRVLPDDLKRVIAEAHMTASNLDGEWENVHPFAVRQRILDLIASRHVIVDDDGDGALEAGETAEIFVTLTNHGDATAIGVVGLARSSGTDYVLIDDTVELGDIAPGTSAEAPPLRLLSTGGDDAFALSFFASDVNRVATLGRTLDGVAPSRPDTLFVDSSVASIRVSWPPVEEADVRGYRVYRSTEVAGPFVPITGIVDAGSYYDDGDVEAIQPYFYRASTVDWSGNEGELSESVTATTSPPILEGWPVTLPSGLSKGSPTLVDLDEDGPLEVVFGWANPMALRSNGGDFVDGDANGLTVGVLASIADGFSQFWNSPAVADIDGDGVLELVYAAWQVNDIAYLYVLDATGAIEPGWPQQIGRIPWSTAAVGDVDGGGGWEIFVSSGEGSASSPFRGALFGFHHDGTEIVDGDSNVTTTGIFHVSSSPNAGFMYGSPALADLDDDGLDEIVFLEKTSHASPTASTLFAFDGNGGVLAGFPYGEGQLLGSTSSPAVADLDEDGDPEIIIVTEDRISVVRSDGTDAPGWPVTLPIVLPSQGNIRDFLTSPAVGDVNLDGSLDIVLGWKDGMVHAWTGETGEPLVGFPTALIDASATFDLYLRSPTLGNIDDDPNPEILVASGDGRLAAANHDGSQVAGFPLRTASVVNGSAALWDIDGDGNVNLIVQSEAPLIEVFDLATVPFIESEHPWPMFRRDARKSGNFASTILPELARGGARTSPGAAAVGAPRPNPLRGGRVRVPFDVPVGGADVIVRVFDVSGREVRRLADGRFPQGDFEISWDGRTEVGRPLAAGVYLLRVSIGDRTFARKVTLVR